MCKIANHFCRKTVNKLFPVKGHCNQQLVVKALVY